MLENALLRIELELLSAQLGLETADFQISVLVEVRDLRARLLGGRDDAILADVYPSRLERSLPGRVIEKIAHRARAGRRR